jgi:hypothetical protein
MVTYQLLIEHVRNKLKHLGIPQREVPKIINAYLPLRDRIDEGRIGEVQVNRWLANGHHRQTVARGDVVLALFQYIYFPIDEHKYEPAEHRADPSGVVYGDPESVRGRNDPKGLQVPEQTSEQRTEPDVSNQLDQQQGL